MENTFYLEIITPDRQFYTGPATNLTMPALDGEYGVQPGHEPVVTALRPGTVRFQTDGTPHEVVVSDGFAEIMPDYCILLVSSAERPDEIDRARAERAKERAEERLRQKQSIREYHLSKAALARAMARLKATRCLPFFIACSDVIRWNIGAGVFADAYADQHLKTQPTRAVRRCVCRQLLPHDGQAAAHPS